MLRKRADDVDGDQIPLDGELEFKARPDSQIWLWGIGAKGIRDLMVIGEEGHRTLERKKAVFL